MSLLDKASLYIAAFAVGSVGLSCLKGFMAIADAEASSPVLSQQAVEPLRVSPLTGFDHTIAGER